MSQWNKTREVPHVVFFYWFFSSIGVGPLLGFGENPWSPKRLMLFKKPNLGSPKKEFMGTCWVVYFITTNGICWCGCQLIKKWWWKNLESHMKPMKTSLKSLLANECRYAVHENCQKSKIFFMLSQYSCLKDYFFFFGVHSSMLK